MLQSKCYKSISSITNICNSIGEKKNLNHKFTLLKESFYLCVFFNDDEKNPSCIDACKVGY